MRFKWVKKNASGYEIGMLQGGSVSLKYGKVSKESICILVPDFGNWKNIMKTDPVTNKRVRSKLVIPRVRAYHPKFGLIHLYMEDNTFHYPEQLRGNFEVILELHSALMEIFPECTIAYEEYKIKKEYEEEMKKAKA